jgi:NADH-quinone oxidoreductase subunit C
MTIAVVDRAKIIEALTALRDEHGFDNLADLTAVDHQGFPGDAPPGRFCVVYNLCRYKDDAQIRVKAYLPEEDPTIASATPVWPAAGWAEREAFDLMGITFKDSPDLRRILLPDEYKHHPLRKDYPVKGLGEREDFETYHR